MALSTQSDIEKQVPEEILIELTDDDGTGFVNTDIVDQCIEDADDEIYSLVGLRYDLPLDSVPGLLNRISRDLAICNMYARRPHLTIPDTQKERCDSGRKMLEKIATGNLSLGADAPSPSPDAGIKTTKTKDDRTFTIGRTSDGSSGTLDNY